MDDLISRSALLKDTEKSVVYSGSLESAFSELRGSWKVTDRIKAAPTVDAVEVVRCKDCKHYNQQFISDETMCCTINAEYDDDVGVWYGLTAYPTPDFFCADGERNNK